MVSLPIYLDNNATTRVDPWVLEEMLPYFTTDYGNASSRNHEYGWRAEEAVDAARSRVADLIGADVRAIVFTSGATESNNLALKGVTRAARGQGNHLVTCHTEHKAVLDPCKRLEREGWRVTYLPVDEQGQVDLLELQQSIGPETVLVSIMVANNEVGTLQPIAEIGKICRERGVYFHTDATQAVGKIPVDVDSWGVDLLSLSAHKFYGPKGIGALFVRRSAPRVRLEPLLDGGGQERGLRSGTLPVPNIVGLGAACARAKVLMETEAPRQAAMRARLEAGILACLDEVVIHGSRAKRLPNTSNLSFAYVDGEALMMRLKDIAVSSGSACTSANLEPSYVLTAMGVAEDLARASLRFSLGRFNREDEIDRAIAVVEQAVTELRRLSPQYEMARASGARCS